MSAAEIAIIKNLKTLREKLCYSLEMANWNMAGDTVLLRNYLIHCGAKKLHRFIFAVSLSNLAIL